MKKGNFVRRSVGAGTVSAMSLLAFANPALAQKATADAPDQPIETNSSPTPATGDIIVTGTRRAESVRDVPFNIQAISADTLAKTGATDIADFARTVPGLSITDGGARDGLKLVLRGLRTGDEVELQPTTTVYVDEVPMDMPYRGVPLDLKLIDIDRVEVLRGPQGTLFGGGAIGGTLRYISKKPNTEELEGRVGGELSGTQHGGANWNLTGMINVPLADWAAVRTNFGHFDNDGYIDNVTLGTKNVNYDRTNSARVAVLLKPVNNLEVDLTYYRQTAQYGESSSGLESHPRLTVDYVHPGVARYRAQLANLTLDYDFGWAKLTSSSSYVDERWDSTADATFGTRDIIVASFLNPDDIPPFTTISTRKARAHKFTQEVRMVSKGDGPFDWIIGGYYEEKRSHELYNELVPLPFPGQAAFEQNILGETLSDDHEYVFYSDSRARQLAAFGELKYKLTDAWQVSAGGRYFQVRGTGSFYSIDQWFGEDARDANGFARTVPLPGEITGGRYSENGAVWRFNSSYKFGNDGLAYLTIAKGFRPGGFNLASPNTGIPAYARQYNSDNLVSYELGAKFSLLNNRIYLSSAIYHIDWSDIQTTVETPLGYSYFGNAGKAISEGVEIEAEVRDIGLRGLSFNLGYSYTNAKLTETIANIGFKGQHMPMVPHHSLSLMADYDTEISGDLKAGFSWLTTYTSSSHGDFGPFKPVADPVTGQITPSADPNRQYLPIGGYWLVNVSLHLEDKKWSARLFANNLLNTRYSTSRIFQNASSNYAGPDVLYAANRPRTIGIELTRRF